MVIVALALVTAAVSSADVEGPALSAAPDPVRAALSRGGYPWYDAPSESVKPTWPPGTGFDEWWTSIGKWFGRRFGWVARFFRWLGRLGIPGMGSLGELVVLGLVILATAVALVVLIELWRRYRPALADSDAVVGDTRALSKGTIVLPAGVQPETDDPWAEAMRCRARGDFGPAIVCLFAHQLLSLERIRLLRPAPGRTARQLVRTIDDRQFRGWVESTLRAFEAVYYGHHVPNRESFEATWSLAEAFQKRLLDGVKP
jgi:hypothetical protein